MGPLFRFSSAWNRFFFAKADFRFCDVLRICYSILLLINLFVLWPDLEKWYGENGVLPSQAAWELLDKSSFSLFQWIPLRPTGIPVFFAILVFQTLCLLVGWNSRVNAACVFIWLTSFQRRNVLILDGEDVVFRLFAFYLMLCPIGIRYSIDAIVSRNREKSRELELRSIWPARLMQMQMALIYLSTFSEKVQGAEWRDGSALYYVSRLDQFFSRFPLPAGPFNSLFFLNLLSWGTLCVEGSLPFALWWKKTRKIALILALIFHLCVDYTMNLFLFQWIMIVGLISFLVQPAPEALQTEN